MLRIMGECGILSFFNFNDNCYYWLGHRACGILVAWPGIEPMYSAVVEAQSWNPIKFLSSKNEGRSPVKQGLFTFPFPLRPCYFSSISIKKSS